MEPEPRGETRRETLGQWSRVLWLDQEIRSGRCPSVADLMEEFSLSRRHALNTVAFMRWSLGAPIEHDRARKGYRYTDPTYALPSVLLQEGELLALLLAQRIAREYGGTPLEAPIRTAVGKIARYLPDDVRIQLEDVAEGFHFAGGSTLEVPERLLLDFRRAVRERQAVRILYHSLQRDEINERVVEPHFLEQVRGDWMVAAWDRMRGTDRVFMLARVREHTVLPERFTRRPELSPGTYREHTFLTERGEAPQEVVLRFDAYQARWIRERSWHPTQRIEEREDGGLVLRLTVSGEGDLLRWILGYGAHVEVLEPPALRERVAAELAQAAGLYLG